jgi:hypothetical protein
MGWEAKMLNAERIGVKYNACPLYCSIGQADRGRPFGESSEEGG